MRFFFLLFLFSCAHSYHQAAVDTSLNPTNVKGKWVEAEAEQFVILGFAFETDYVELAHARLLTKCSGTISPIATSYLTDLSFLSWTNRVKLKGVCLN